MKIFEL